MDEPMVRYQALESGATDVLNKPVDHHECRARCHNLLMLRRQQQTIRNRNKWLERQVAEATRQLRTREREALMRLARVAAAREDPTGARLRNIAAIARCMATDLGLTDEESDTI